jgi:hypothetical protein
MKALFLQVMIETGACIRVLIRTALSDILYYLSQTWRLTRKKGLTLPFNIHFAAESSTSFVFSFASCCLRIRSSAAAAMISRRLRGV